MICAAPAQAKTIKSEIAIGSTSAGGGTVTIEGSVSSKRNACLAGRKVTFSVVNGGVTTKLQGDVSSRNGYAGGTGPGGFPEDAVAKLEPKRVGSGLRCSGDRTAASEQRRTPSARGGTIPGTFQFNNLSYAGGRIGATGRVNSVQRCTSKRRIETFPFDDGVSKKPLGYDISSRNGFWGTFAKSNSEGVGLRLTAKKISAGKRCGGDVYRYDPDPNRR